MYPNAPARHITSPSPSLPADMPSGVIIPYLSGPASAAGAALPPPPLQDSLLDEALYAQVPVPPDRPDALLLHGQPLAFGERRCALCAVSGLRASSGHSRGSDTDSENPLLSALLRHTFFRQPAWRLRRPPGHPEPPLAPPRPEAISAVCHTVLGQIHFETSEDVRRDSREEAARNSSRILGSNFGVLRRADIVCNWYIIRGLCFNYHLSSALHHYSMN